MLEACHGALGNVKELERRVEKKLFRQDSMERKIFQYCQLSEQDSMNRKRKNLSIVKQLLIFRRLLEDIIGADGTVHAGE